MGAKSLCTNGIMMKLYGIANCDTVKKARIYLQDNHIEFDFIDFKKIKPTKADLLRWKKVFGGWPLNTKGPTYRKHEAELESLSEAQKPDFIIENSSMIKRPILERDGVVLAFGFDEEVYKKLKTPY
jgi:Spx/MgsR family transcriptional regulator